MRCDEDTICAIATPVGEGGIGIVRISGSKALPIAEEIVRLRSGQPLKATSSHTLHLADIVFPRRAVVSGLPISDAQLIDEGLVVFMNASRSFTAEDVVEVQCHGSGVVLGRVCEACIAAGARLAEPGEFTKRAFMNGRLDLSQAEAVLDTIRAKSESGLRVAQRHLRGDLRRQVEQLRMTLLAMLAHVEAGIDFVEEEIAFIGREELMRSLKETLDRIHDMLLTARAGRLLREGVRVVIRGRPNVGKSSLLNCFLKEPRAIVTDIPGTTRDVLEEEVVWDGLVLTLVDTAGLRASEDLVEQEGMKRTKLAEADADVLLHVLDATEVLTDAAVEPLAYDAYDGKREIVAVNKIDLINVNFSRELVERVRRVTKREVIPISVRTGVGVEELKKRLVAHVSGGSAEATDGVVITNVRHRSALERSSEALAQAVRSIENQVEAACVAVDLRDAADALGEITGAITTDEVLGRIFSEFCIGK